jgi:hypothetical protein
MACGARWDASGKVFLRFAKGVSLVGSCSLWIGNSKRGARLRDPNAALRLLNHCSTPTLSAGQQGMHFSTIVLRNKSTCRITLIMPWALFTYAGLCVCSLQCGAGLPVCWSSSALSLCKLISAIQLWLLGQCRCSNRKCFVKDLHQGHAIETAIAP